MLDLINGFGGSISNAFEATPNQHYGVHQKTDSY